MSMTVSEQPDPDFCDAITMYALAQAHRLGDTNKTFTFASMHVQLHEALLSDTHHPHDVHVMLTWKSSLPGKDSAASYIYIIKHRSGLLRSSTRPGRMVYRK